MTGSGPPGASGVPSREESLAWSSYRRLVVLICTGATCPTALRIALVVGTILTATNQGAVLLSGETSWATLARIAVNYVVPFTVSSVGYLAPFRTPALGPGPAGPRVRAPR